MNTTNGSQGSASSNDNKGAPTAGALPLFYKDPQPVNSQRHAKAGIKESHDFRFARDTNSVPLGADELFVALASYPIVFTQTDPPVPAAVLGVGGDRNAFVDEEGRWRANTYIPAYIRRYPFIFATGPDKQLYLAIDEAADSFSPRGGKRLFEDAAPSKITQQARDFCQAFQGQLQIAQALGAALQGAGVLEPKRIDIQRTDGASVSLDGFQVVDEARFDALPDEVFLEWRRSRLLGLVYAHLMSMRRWQTFATPPGSAQT